MPDGRHYVALTASTQVRPTPLVPEVVLHTADDAYAVWVLTATAPDGSVDESVPMPFWSFPWAGGQALARYVLDHPEVVAGRTVLDLAAGSGLVAIAAALAGAAQVTANDVDPYAAAAQELNAQANGVTLTTLTADILDEPAVPGGVSPDVVLAGDVCYERGLADRMLTYLLRARDSGADVLVGDPGRAYLPVADLEEVAGYDVPTSLALEDQLTKRATVWRPRDATPHGGEKGSSARRRGR